WALSSSGISGDRGSSVNPDGSQAESNQSGSGSRVRLIHVNGATRLQLVQSFSDSDEYIDDAWQGRLGVRCNPLVDSQPDTQELDQNPHGHGLIQPESEAKEQGRCHSYSFSHGECSHIRSHFLPNHVAHKDTYQQKAFCGVYSNDGNMFPSAGQGEDVGFDDGVREEVVYPSAWKLVETQFLFVVKIVYYSRVSGSTTTRSTYIYFCSVDGDSETHTDLDLNPDKNRFCVCSLVASRGKGVIGDLANDGCFYVIDREQNKRTLKVCVPAAVLLCKVWDRLTLWARSDTETVSPSSTAGYRFIIIFLSSPCRDQSIKWDMRKSSPMEGLVALRLNIVQQDTVGSSAVSWHPY
uniref:Uncharacterized protein n=1 Tax=Oncorhynchus tshawytscha TaxID=74940 RepID=A0AAZ3QVD8_ONCTS